MLPAVVNKVVVKVLGSVVVLVVGNNVVVCGSSVVVSIRVVDLVIGVIMVAMGVAMEGRIGRVADMYHSRKFLSMAISHTRDRHPWYLGQWQVASQ